MMGFFQRIQNHKIWAVSKHDLKPTPILQAGKKGPSWAGEERIVCPPLCMGCSTQEGVNVWEWIPGRAVSLLFQQEKDQDICQLGLGSRWMGSCWLRLSPSHGYHTLPTLPPKVLLPVEMAKHLETVLPGQEGPTNALKIYGQTPASFLHSPTLL